MLALAYEEYNHNNPEPGWAELDSVDVLEKTKRTIAKVANKPGMGSIRALSVTSLGEAMVPVTRDRKVLGPFLLNYGRSGEEYFLSGEQLIINQEVMNSNPLVICIFL